MTAAPVAPSLPRACAQCPWRLANQGQRHPHGFYTAANLRRLWTGLRTGEAPGMTCHPTDSRMADFAGYEETAARELAHECTGAVTLVAREVMRFQAICFALDSGALEGTNALKEYRRQAPKGLTRAGLAEVVARFLFGDSPLTRAIRVDVRAINDEAVGYPPLGEWDPKILERAGGLAG